MWPLSISSQGVFQVAKFMLRLVMWSYIHDHNYMSCPETNTSLEMEKVCLFLKHNEREV